MDDPKASKDIHFIVDMFLVGILYLPAVML